MSLLPILTHLPCLLLQVPDLLSDDRQFAAGICSDKVIGLGEKIRAGQNRKNNSPLDCAEPAVVKLKASTELGGAGAVLAPLAGARTRSCLDRLRGSEREQQDMLGSSGLEWEVVGYTGSRQDDIH